MGESRSRWAEEGQVEDGMFVCVDGGWRERMRVSLMAVESYSVFRHR